MRNDKFSKRFLETMNEQDTNPEAGTSRAFTRSVEDFILYHADKETVLTLQKLIAIVLKGRLK